MEYEWEDDARQKVKASCGKYTVIGVAVVNELSGEACFIQGPNYYSGVAGADFMQDVFGDVESIYEIAVSNMSDK